VLEKDGKDELDQSCENGKVLHTARRRGISYIQHVECRLARCGHILHRNCLLKHVTEGEIQGRTEVMGRRGRRSLQLLDDLKEKTGYSKMKQEALDHTLQRIHFGRGNGPVVRQEYLNSAWQHYVTAERHSTSLTLILLMWKIW
jgi:hypothetical protein